MSIEVKGLTKIYGTQKAVDNLSFSISEGEIVGFLGPNGAGKSTTMKMITGYLTPDAGSILVNGIYMLKEPLKAKAKIGYLPEANPLYFDMYVQEYLSFVAGIFRLDNKTKRIQDVIELTGLQPEKHKKIGQLSKGYKQRTGLAAALIHDPEILILDEPTSGLDPNQLIEIRNVIREQGKKKTVLFSSHILQEVEAICDRILIIDKGVLKKDSLLEDLTEFNDSKRVIKLVFKETIEASWLLRLSAIESAERDKRGVWTLTCKDEGLAKKQIMELALKEDFNIVSLESASVDLEQTFREMTQ
ncbi:MAG: gliding motility-associated ABC transporter ATP-binding subunit GldA [Pseudopedobacter saltans]|uniref:Gliding motility-associated ABC transporter ATP-binding subunit GldA n=1 Tax=Pseudopedobacter saltans TaxID=151895 RepID=A0A2W5F3X5_9SPHI|nr:MAG: gliding motility-associated ABC transporter ATP-binding subunit GldA [Pseudopedobacter saltans]